MKNFAYYGGMVAFASSLLLPVATAWAASPPNINTDIDWNEGDNNANTYGSTVDDIMAAYNNARRNEETQLGLSADTLGNLELPTQAVWDGMSDDAKALFLINAERTARSEMFNGVLGLPLAGVEQTVDTVAETYANLLHTTDETGHFQPSGDSNVDNPFQRVNDAVGVMCRDFLPRAENLAYFSASSTQPIGAESIPLPLERAIYSWIYDDADSQWGHREAVLLQDQSISEVPQPGFDNNYSAVEHEGFLGIHVIGSTGYTPFGTNEAFPFNYGVAVVMNVYDPVHQVIASNPANNCSYLVTLRTEDLPEVSDSNRAPVAGDDTASTDYETAVSISVLENDSDPDGDFIDYQLIDDEPVIGNPANGTVSIQEDMSLLYTPNAAFSGTDSFTYTITDPEGETASATVTVRVGAAPNLPPVANDDTASTDAGTQIMIRVLDNDSDPEGGILDYLVQDVFPYAPIISDPENGTTTLSEDMLIIYTPDAGFVGVDTFTYTIIDDQNARATATVTVTVNGAANQEPTAENDSASTDYETAVDINVLNNDSDPDAGDTLSVSAVGTPGNGSANENGGVITYTPADGFSGEDSFTYTVTDGNGGSATATVTVTVGDAPPTGENQAPNAVDDAATTRRNRTVLIDLLGNDTDADGDTLSIVNGTNPTNGRVMRLPNNQVIYRPNRRFFGTDSFSYTISDGNGGTDTATVTVTVQRRGGSVNRPPRARADTIRTRSGQSQTIDLLANDSDREGDSFRLLGGITPRNGTVVRNDDGTITYTPNEGFRGRDNFRYMIVDEHGGVAQGLVRVRVRR